MLIFKRNHKKTKNHNNAFMQSLSTFHTTTFSFSNTWRMALSFFVLYVVMSYLSSHLDIWLCTWNQGTLMVMQFICVEMIPIIFIGLCFGLTRRNYNIRKLSAWKHAWTVIRDWIDHFAKDLWNHKMLLLSLVIIMFMLGIVVTEFVQKFMMNGVVMPSRNTKMIMALMRKNAGMLIASGFIAPVTEELFFRFWFTGTVYHFANELWRGHAQWLTYWGSALASALFFAALHLQGQPPATGMSYVAVALFLQLIMKKTRSLTAPIWVHSISNLLLLGMKLLA